MNLRVAAIGLAVGYAACTSQAPEGAPDASTDGIPQCTPRAGTDRFGFYPVEALPAGACNGEPDCELLVAEACPGNPEAAGAKDGYRCSCVNRTWTCVDINPGGGVCPPPDRPDGGRADAQPFPKDAAND